MKRIFYYTDVLIFLTKGQDAIDKLEQNLQMFHEAEDRTKLVWHPWSGTEHYLKINNSPVLEQYLKIFDDYKKMGWGEIDLSCGLEAAKDVLMTCDAYYGDMSDLIYDAQSAQLPVMIQNIDIR